MLLLLLLLLLLLSELDGRGNLPKMKMLQKMRLLEEQGSSFATTALKDLKVFGELAGYDTLLEASVRLAT
jgi:hypothetical protein